MKEELIRYIEVGLRGSKNAIDKFCVADNYQTITRVSFKIKDALLRGNKVIIFGNGGSASDADHFAAELVGRLSDFRRPFPVISLSNNGAVLTCIGNDFGFERIFSRQISAFAVEGDIVIGISTSGKSVNVKNALAAAMNKNIYAFGVFGKDGNGCKHYCNDFILVDEEITQRVQEVHHIILHSICEAVLHLIYDFKLDSVVKPIT